MRPDELLAWKRAAPFHPFRIQLADRRAFVVNHPCMVKVGRDELYIVEYEGNDPQGFAARVHLVEWPAVATIEPLDSSAQAAPGGAR